MTWPLRLACVQAYNDFQAEFASTDPSRLIPLCYLPWWDLDAAMKEQHLVPLLPLYPDNVMFETDYPHSRSLSPGENSYAKSARDTIIENLGSVPEEILRKILHDNAARVYGLT